MLTLEPLVEAVREGVEAGGWEVSGLQKTTSYQFEGRWEGDSTRSAYLFFHLPEGTATATASLDVFLDETSKGLSGNLALVLDGRSLAELGDVETCLRELAGVARGGLPRGHRTPLTLRFHLHAPDAEPGSAEAEIRFKVRIPRSAMSAGASAVSSLASITATSMRSLLESPRLAPFLDRH
jgi:hypothetical protein